MTIHFIGAGPGAPDLLTLRGRDLIAASPVCLYAGSLVPEGVLSHCPPGARIVNTAPLSLAQIVAEMREAHQRGQDVARLHSGDLSVWSAMGEQLRALREEGIAFTVTPGVPSFAASTPGSMPSNIPARPASSRSCMCGSKKAAAQTSGRRGRVSANDQDGLHPIEPHQKFQVTTSCM